MSTIKQQLDQDLKIAMLAGEKDKVTTLRGLKGAVLNVEIAKGSREQGLSDEEIIDVFSKEVKKRQESAEMYVQGGNQERADAELAEKTIIEHYLPAQMSDDELKAIVDSVITDTAASGMQAMGQVIGQVKQKTAGQADGARIAQFVKEKLAS
jgi:uncharacterized protein YqeY